jgi:1-deoxy-D-xylulose-5-phosphate reductoisomerase
MSFESMDSSDHKHRFPGLSLAWAALAGTAGMTAVLNASNEVAVDLFLSQRIRFDQIHEIIMNTLSLPPPAIPKNLEDLLNIDSETRILALENAKKLTSFK